MSKNWGDRNAWLEKVGNIAIKGAQDRIERAGSGAKTDLAILAPPKHKNGTRGVPVDRTKPVTRRPFEIAFPDQCAQYGLPRPVSEFRFDSLRRFRWDFCWPDQKVAVEVQGGLFAKGRAKAAHAMPIGILRDYEKSNLGQLQGWTVLFYTPMQLYGALPEIKRALGMA